jgi:hypothetical protein
VSRDHPANDRQEWNMRRIFGFVLTAFFATTASAWPSPTDEAHSKLAAVIALPGVDGHRYELVPQGDPCTSLYRQAGLAGSLIHWGRAERVEFMPGEPGQPAIWTNWVQLTTADGTRAFHPVAEQVGPLLQAANALIRACRTAPTAARTVAPSATRAPVAMPPCPPTRAALASVLSAQAAVGSVSGKAPKKDGLTDHERAGYAGRTLYDPTRFSILGATPSAVSSSMRDNQPSDFRAMIPGSDLSAYAAKFRGVVPGEHTKCSSNACVWERLPDRTSPRGILTHVTLRTSSYDKEATFYCGYF